MDITRIMPATVALIVLGAAVGAVLGVWLARRIVAGARQTARGVVDEARSEAENHRKEIFVSTQERMLALQEESDRRDRELDERETRLEQQAVEARRLRETVDREKQQIDRRRAEIDRAEREAEDARRAAVELRDRAASDLERVAGMTREEAHRHLVETIESEAREVAERRVRKIEDEARETADRRSRELLSQAAERVHLRDVLESTVSFIELPSDEMKGRIIGREGRNIRALELATGIDLIVDDTPRSILISSFDPLRREVARVAIDRLVEDGRIHPARIEEVVEKVRQEVDELVDQKGTEAAYRLGLSDIHPRLLRRVGRMRYRMIHGQNLLQHAIETSLISRHLADHLGADPGVVVRVGLLHEIGLVEDALSGHPIHAAAEQCARFGESEQVVEAIRSLHPEVDTRGIEAQLVALACRMSQNRPGARKENLSVYIERLRRLEEIALAHEGVGSAYAVKAGKELRVLVEAQRLSDRDAQRVSKEIARQIEQELSYPGQIKVSVIRETRAVQYAV